MDATPQRLKPSTLARCPECDADLFGVDIRAHALYHWPVPLDERMPQNEGAVKRRKEMMRAAGKQRADLDQDE